MSRRRAHVVDCRPVRDTDPPDWPRSHWVATDSAGRRFVDSSESAARRYAEDYQAGRAHKVDVVENA